MKDYLINQSNTAVGYMFKEVGTDALIGYIWLMHKGGNEIQYRIRNIDAFIFDAFVS